MARVAAGSRAAFAQRPAQTPVVVTMPPLAHLQRASEKQSEPRVTNEEKPSQAGGGEDRPTK